MRSVSTARGPTAFRGALSSVPPAERDAWVDAFLGLTEIPSDEEDLPRGCVPYLPCSVGVLLRALALAEVGPDDVFVDVGAGLGRTAICASLCTGARAIGIEVQGSLVQRARAVANAVGASRTSFVHADAAAALTLLEQGTVFFLYCPFSGARLLAVLDELRRISRSRVIRLCCVDLPLPVLDWLTPIAPETEGLIVFRSSGALVPSGAPASG